jgi:general stress protein 26
MDAQGTIWFLTSKKDLAPLVGDGGSDANLAFMKPSDSRYVSVAGRARLVDDAQRKQALWSPMARAWFSGPDDPDLTLLCVEPRQAEVWQGPELAVTRLLAMAASAVAGKEIGLGDKKTLTR